MACVSALARTHGCARTARGGDVAPLRRRRAPARCASAGGSNRSGSEGAASGSGEGSSRKQKQKQQRARGMTPYGAVSISEGEDEVAAAVRSFGQQRENGLDAPVSAWAPPAATTDSGPGQTSFVAETLLPTSGGEYRVRAYRHAINGGMTEPLAIVFGDVEGKSDVPVRVHDACFTGEALGSLKCDCAQQLHLALEYIRENGPGIVLYLQQEGRGIGLANKIAAYAMQEQGFDTVDANRVLGLPDDSREYSAVRNMLEDMDVKSIKLLTNNPRKIERMSSLGVEITGRVPVVVTPADAGPLKRYLQTKEERMNHQLEGAWCVIDEDHI